MIRVEAYRQADGRIPYREWFDGLNAQIAARIRTAISRLEEGNTSTIKWFLGIGEIKIDFGPGYRVYLAADGGKLIVLLGGGTKQRQQSDIERAVELHAEYKQRKAAFRRKNEIKKRR